MPPTPYTYRSDPAVPAFDDSAPIVIFDGMCVLCSRGVQWMLARDPHGTTKFAAIQEPIPRALYKHYGLDADTFDTFLVLADGRPYTRWAGLLAAGRTLGFPWGPLARVGRLIPDAIGNRLYDIMQRNRIAWFGSRTVCLRPEPAHSRRFLVAG